MKGSLFDIIFVTIFIFVFAVSFFFGYIIMDKFKAEVNQTNTIDVSYIQTGQDAFLIFDGLMVFVIAMLFISVIISAFLIDVHPVFFVISLIFLVLSIFVGAQISNIFIEFSQASDIAVATSNYPLTIYLFQNLPTIILVFGIIISIVIYSKIRQGGI